MERKLKNQIRYIKTADIVPHPDNPRQDLGDLTELADSIRAKGILENLVVIRNPENFRRIAFSEGGSAELWDNVNAPEFMVVIGHRRLAAAKLAGLESVPCVLQDMTRDEAIAAMLTENGQRTALTPYEEACGFRQLSLDMGKSVKQISEMTGFGETTIRGRLKIAGLDGGKTKKALERGATLADFVELSKLKDPDLINKVLDKAGTPNFKNALKSAEQEERHQALLERWTSEAGVFAERVTTVNHLTMAFVRSYDTYSDKKLSVERPGDAGERRYYYTVNSPRLSLYREITEQDNAEKAAIAEAKAAAEAARKARQAKLGEITARHFALRKEFVAECAPTPGQFAPVMGYVARMLSETGRVRPECDLKLLGELLGVSFERLTWADAQKEIAEFLCSGVRKHPEARLLLCAAYAMTDRHTNGYYKPEWNQSTGVIEVKYKENPGLDRLYDLLTTLGYEVSEEETQMLTGKHELFREDSGGVT